MKNILRQDFKREIRRNIGRFLSIFFIVMLGTAFFSGVRSAGGDMKYNADDIYNRSKMMDIRVLGTLGLTQEDLSDIQKIESVESAVGGHTKEVLVNRSDEQLVLKLIAATSGVNEVILTEGRLPQKAGECVTDDSLSEYGIGDVIRVESGTEEEITEDLNETEFTVVGKGNLPYYLDLTRGVGSIGNGTLSGFLVIPDAAFDMDVYTEIYVQVKGADQYSTYSSEYEKLIGQTVDEIEALDENLTARRYNEVITDAQEQIDDAKKELNDGQKELDDARKELDDAKKELEDGQKELEDAKKELDDGKTELDDAKKQVEDGETELADAKQELDDGEKQLVDAKEELDAVKATLEDGEKQLADAKKQLDASKTQIEDGEKELADAKKILDEKKPELDAAKAQLDEAKAELDTGKEQLDEGGKQLEDAKTELEEGFAELEKNKEELEASHAETEAGKKAIEEGWAAYEAGKAQLEEQAARLAAAKTTYQNMLSQLEMLKAALEADPENPELIAQVAALTAMVESAGAQIAAGEALIAQGQAALEASYKELSENQAALDAAEEQLAWADEQLAAGYERYYAGKAEYEAKLAEYEQAVEKYETGKAEYEAGLALYEEGKKEYDNGVAAYEAALAQFEDGKKQYEEGLAAYEQALAEFEDGKAQYEEGLTKYEDGVAEWEDGRRQYEDGLKEWEDGKKQYEDALIEYEDGVKKYEDGLKEYEDGLKEYEDGEKEYQDAYDEHMPEIEDGWAEVREAEEDLAKIKVPDLYVLDRDMIQSSASFEQDAKRMDSLGNVFPVIFFLVAALVSLTAMTRMVDEQRQQIGTLKALGFSRSSITWKYLKYALIPSLTGGIIGVLVGEYVIPLVIVNAYRMMYTGLDRTLITYNAKEGILAVVIACACTAAATMAACYSKLRDKPAELMRPEAPKSGKRVFLEYVKPVWNRMNFTAKSTVRNLFRYKKRLIMTIVGIGACMGLMMVGFGLHDSITDVAKRQYREIFMQDASVSLDLTAKDSQIERLEKTIETIDGLNAQMRLANISATLYKGKKDRSAVLYIPEDIERVGDFLRFQDRVTRTPYDFPETGVGLAEKTADMLGVSVGDTIEVQKGESGRKAKAEVTVIVENYVQHYCFMTPETYASLFNEEPEFNEILLDYEDTSKENQKEIGRLLIAEDACTSVTFTTDFQKVIDDMLATLTMVIWVLIISAGLLAFVVLYNLNNINIMERKRELATLKVLGFQDMEVAMYVYRENVFLTLLGIVLGCFLGMILHRFTIMTVEVDLMMFGRSVRAGSYVISAVLTLVFALIVNTAMYFSLKKIDMIESLKSVE